MTLNFPGERAEFDQRLAEKNCNRTFSSSSPTTSPDLRFTESIGLFHSSDLFQDYTIIRGSKEHYVQLESAAILSVGHDILGTSYCMSLKSYH